MNHDKLDREIFACDKCVEAKKYRAYPMPGFYGKNCFEKIAVIAQNPGLPNEIQKSKKFTFDEIAKDYIDGLRTSQMGKFLSEILTVNKEQIFYSNVVKCAFPPHYILDSEIVNCGGYLKRQLEVVKPKIVICIGSVALRFFRPEASLQKCSLSILRDNSYSIFPIFHYGYLSHLKNQNEYLSKARSKLIKLMQETYAEQIIFS